MDRRQADGPKIALAAIFVTSLVTAQLLAVKLLVVPVPTELPLLEASVLVPAGVLAYALTYVASDCYTELYGRRAATVMVNIAFAMNFVMLALVWLAIIAPGSDAGVDPEAFATVLGLSTNIVLGSLAAYLVSQNWDVWIFDRIGTYTDGRYLWLRNIGSTTTSQFVDTGIFILMAFLIVPTLIGVGEALPALVLVQLLIGQYVIKVGIALLETPLVYAIVGLIRGDDWVMRRIPLRE